MCSAADAIEPWLTGIDLGVDHVCAAKLGDDHLDVSNFESRHAAAAGAVTGRRCRLGCGGRSLSKCLPRRTETHGRAGSAADNSPKCFASVHNSISFLRYLLTLWRRNKFQLRRPGVPLTRPTEFRLCIPRGRVGSALLERFEGLRTLPIIRDNV